MSDSQTWSQYYYLDGGGELNYSTGFRSNRFAANVVRSCMYNDDNGSTTGVRVVAGQVDMFSGGTNFTDSTTNIASFATSAISLIPPVSFTEQLTLPNSPIATGYSGGIMTINFNSRSTGIFSTVLGSNMTGISFSNGRIGGQYVVYVTATGATRTIAYILSGTASRTNYTSVISVTLNSTALLTITYDGTRYLIAGSAYN